MKQYDNAFFERIKEGSFLSAKPILDVIYRVYPIKSIVDFGCGFGAWLTAAKSLGADELRGIDGDWVNPGKLMLPEIDFSHGNFESPIPNPGRYDISMSAEVGEHVSEASADFLVDALCAASDLVLFGAAIPGQTGTNHINCKFQSWWAAKFREREFLVIDGVRPHVWNNDEVHWWYRQNLLLYCKKENKDLLAKIKPLEQPVLDIVHPSNYLAKHNLHFNPSLRIVLGALKHCLLRKKSAR